MSIQQGLRPLVTSLFEPWNQVLPAIQDGLDEFTHLLRGDIATGGCLQKSLGLFPGGPIGLFGRSRESQDVRILSQHGEFHTFSGEDQVHSVAEKQERSPRGHAVCPDHAASTGYTLGLSVESRV